MTKKKKMILIICIIICVAAIVGGAIYYFLFRGDNGSSSASADVAYVDSVAMITGLGSNNGTQNRFTGVVEAQETLEVKKSTDKTIKEIFVSAGDSVEIGTPLFEYDTDEIALKLQQERINLESITNEITGYYNQINELQKEKKTASADEQLSYTTQIQEAQLNAKRSEYNKKSKEAEIEKLQKDLANATVTSEIAGTVKEVNPTDTYDPYSGTQKPFMSIMASGEYRIKGKVNETNVWSLMEGQPVILRSRVDSEMTWQGTISKIDTQNSYDSGNNNGGSVYVGGGPSESGEKSTFYAFYITPDSLSGLNLGQHLFIELDNGQDEKKEGLWLNSMYLVMEENDAYVWVADSKNKLEKRKLELGKYDSSLDEYEIVSGLTTDEYIAFPGNLLKEGMSCVINDGTHTNSSDDMNTGDGMNGGDMGNGIEGGMGGDMEGGADGGMNGGDMGNGMEGGVDDGMGGGADGSMGDGSMDGGMNGDMGNGADAGADGSMSGDMGDGVDAGTTDGAAGGDAGTAPADGAAPAGDMPAGNGGAETAQAQ